MSGGLPYGQWTMGDEPKGFEYGRPSFYVALFHGAPGAVGKVIRWQTRSKYSHAALVFDRNLIALLPGGGAFHLQKQHEGIGSKFNHAQTWNFVTIEAREFRGVRLTEGIVVAPGTKVDLFRVDPRACWGLPIVNCQLAAAVLKTIWEWSKGEVGKEYDYTMVARFITRRQESRSTSEKWFCSELVFAALAKAGINLLRDVEPWAVSPGLLAKSPLLEFERTI